MAKNKSASKRWKERWKDITYFFRHFNRKHRVSVFDQHGETEVWYMYISPMRITFAVLGVLIVMLVGLFFLVGYTPIMDLAPGYPGKKSREMITQSILRLDSLENELNYVRAYSDNISLIMEGRMPESTGASPTESADVKDILPPSLQDSLLRMQIEGSDRYSLYTDPQVSGTGRNLPAIFVAPVQGRISAEFNPAGRVYGLEYAVSESQEVVAVRDGTVLMSMWTPSEGHIIQIQHKDNFISIYKYNSQLLKNVGDIVVAGEAIGYVSVPERSTLPDDGRFVLELWYDGRPVDPTYYISY